MPSGFAFCHRTLFEISGILKGLFAQPVFLNDFKATSEFRRMVRKLPLYPLQEKAYDNDIVELSQAHHPKENK